MLNNLFYALINFVCAFLIFTHGISVYVKHKNNVSLESMNKNIVMLCIGLAGLASLYFYLGLR